MNKYILILALSLLMVSCQVSKTSTAKSLDIYGTVMHIPVVADLDVKQTKVSITIDFQGNLTKSIKDKAIGEALKKTNADILIEPSFEIETKGSSSKITVTGFPASYKNFRNASQGDIELLKAGVIQKSDKSEATVK